MGRDQKNLCCVGLDGFPMGDSWEKGSLMDFFLGRPRAEGPAPHWLLLSSLDCLISGQRRRV